MQQLSLVPALAPLGLLPAHPAAPRSPQAGLAAPSLATPRLPDARRPQSLPPAAPGSGLPPPASPREGVPAMPVAAALPRPATVAPGPASPLPAGLQSPALQDLLRGKLWRGDAVASPLAGSIPSGFRQLDQQLPGGGWPTHCLTELLHPANGIGEMRLLMQSLQTLSQVGRQIILLAPPCLPYPAGWAHFGIDVDQLLLVRTERPCDRLWAIEQALRSTAFGALLAWVPEARPEALRRLQLAAAGANGLSFLFRPVAAQHQPSPAPLRLLLEGGAGRTLDVRLLKRRGPVHGETLRLHLPELRALQRGAATPATAGVFSSSPVASHALDRTALSHPAARSHPAPLA